MAKDTREEWLCSKLREKSGNGLRYERRVAVVKAKREERLWSKLREKSGYSQS